MPIAETLPQKIFTFSFGCAVYQSGWSNPATRTTDERLPLQDRRGSCSKAPDMSQISLLYFVAIHGRPATLQATRMLLDFRVRLTVSVFVDVPLTVPLGIRNEFARRVDTF